MSTTYDLYLSNNILTYPSKIKNTYATLMDFRPMIGSGQKGQRKVTVGKEKSERG